jgi:hypothetical protein
MTNSQTPLKCIHTAQGTDRNIRSLSALKNMLTATCKRHYNSLLRVILILTLEKTNLHVNYTVGIWFNCDLSCASEREDMLIA